MYHTKSSGQYGHALRSVEVRFGKIAEMPL
jgi:hypothetical protein